jgi:hypothetical protein
MTKRTDYRDPILATRRNMEKYASTARTLANGVTIRAADPVAYSPITGEEYSATSGDYYMRGMDDPLLDSEGEPMILVRVRMVYEPV